MEAWPSRRCSPRFMRDKKRRSILEGRALSPELRKRPDACRAIDSVLARATALAPDQRHQDAQELANALGPWLTETREPPKPSRRLVNSLLNMAAPGDIPRRSRLCAIGIDGTVHV